MTDRKQVPCVSANLGNVPSLYLKDREKYKELYKLCEDHGYRYAGHSVSNTIRVVPETIYDYRDIMTLCIKNKIHFYKYTVPESNMIKVILRSEANLYYHADQAFHEILYKKQIPVLNMFQMYGTDHDKLPLMLAFAARGKAGRKIYNLDDLFGYPVLVEDPRTEHAIWQCRRCQGFGHPEKTCEEPELCTYCDGSHLTERCKLKRMNETNRKKCTSESTSSVKSAVSSETLGAAEALLNLNKPSASGKSPKKISKDLVNESLEVSQSGEAVSIDFRSKQSTPTMEGLNESLGKLKLSLSSHSLSSDSKVKEYVICTDSDLPKTSENSGGDPITLQLNLVETEPTVSTQPEEPPRHDTTTEIFSDLSSFSVVGDSSDFPHLGLKRFIFTVDVLKKMEDANSVVELIKIVTESEKVFKLHYVQKVTKE